MAIAVGTQVALGVGAESVYGTAVAPTAWFPIIDENVEFQPEDIVSEGLRYGSNFFMEAARRIRSHRHATGGFTVELQKSGMDLLFQHMLGNESADTPTAGDTTWDVASLLEDSLTVQKRLYDEAQSEVTTYTASGGIVTSWELTLERGSIPTVNLGMEFTDLVDSVVGTSPSYSSVSLWTPNDSSLEIDSSAEGGVLSLTLTAANPRQTRRYISGSAATVADGFRTLTGTLTYDFSSTTFWDLIDGDTLSDWDVIWTDTAGNVLTITLQDVHITPPSTPTVGGPGPVEQSVSFEVLYDGTNSPVTIVDEPA